MEKKTFTTLGLALCAMAASVTAAQTLLAALVRAVRPLWAAQPWFLLALVPVFYFLGAPLFYLLVRRLPRETRTEKRPLSFWHFAGVFCLAMALVYIGSWVGLLVTSMLAPLFGGSTLNPVADIISGNSLWLIVLIVGILSPLAEELVFRKLLLDRLRPFGDRVAILYSALAFALYHMNFSQFFYAFLVGCLLAYVALRTNSFFFPAALHSLVNLVGSVLMPLLLGDATNADLTDPTALLTPQLLAAVLLLTVFFVGALADILANRRRFALQPARWRFSVPVDGRLILLNAGSLLYIAGCLVFFFFSLAV
ncbi:MAG: type II CAAX endopeptidase family protein [Oscillospiraceae bacterium]|nr:type II CAAX endopeptidase family protein [Oscillospiraceae bacterium]